jgi:alkyl hydroperoxide reductase subunit AhpF
MGIQKDAKGAWKDSKKFAKKHPFVSLVIGGAAAYTAANLYFTSYVMTKAFEMGNQ